MQAQVYNLIDRCLEGAGMAMMTHPEVDKVLFPEAQYRRVYSKENTKLYYERELVEISRPLEHLIILVGGSHVKEHIVSYAMEYDIESLAGAEWDRKGYDRLVERVVTVRLSLIVSSIVDKEGMPALEYAKIFLWHLLWNPPKGIEDWWRSSATLNGFSDTYDLPHLNAAGFDEKEILGCWFAATFKQVILPVENVALIKL